MGLGDGHQEGLGMRRDWERERDWERDCYVIATPQSMGIIQALDKNSLPTKDKLVYVT